MSGWPDADSLRLKFIEARNSLKRDLNRALMRGGVVVAGQAQREASGPRPTHIGVISNRLRSSLSAVLVSTGRVKVGTNVEYAPLHEYGGRTPPRIILPVHKKALAFGGIVVRRVNHPGGNYPPRPFLHPALDKKRAQVVTIVRAVYAGPLHLGGTSA